MSFPRWFGEPGFRRYGCRLILPATLLFLTYALGEVGPQDMPGPAAPPSGKDAANPRSFELEAAANGAMALADAALREGIAVPPEAVAKRVEIYKKLYPGKDVDPSKVEKIVLAEKYLAAKGIGAGDEDLDLAASGKWDPSRFATPEEENQAKQAVRIQILLGRDEVKREASKLENLAQVERQSAYKPATNWEPMKLQIQGDPEACLAWSGPSCFLTIQEYNAACTQFRISGQLEIDSAKSMVLRQYMLEKRRAELAREQGLEQKTDSILARVREIRDSHRWMQSARRFGIPVFDNTQLQATYSKYYSQYFAARQKVTFALVGSTDSAYIDSLYQVFAAWEKSAGRSKHGSETAKVREPRLPWAYFDADELPRELEAPADGLRIGQASKPFPAPYGRFIIRLVKIVRIGEIPASRAFPQLTFLATRDKFLDMDSVIEAKARRYYAENQTRYSVPDTMGLTAWLVPGPGNRIGAKPDGKPKILVPPDTTIFKAVTTSSLLLPEDIRIQLQEAARKDSLKTFLGPLGTKYGQWCFRILSRKQAHRMLPFRLVRKDILERISAPLPQVDPGLAEEESISEVLLNIGLSEAYQREEVRKSMAAEGQKSAEADSRPDRSTHGDKAEALAADMARMQAEQTKYHREEEELLSGTKVNRSLFFR